MKFESMFREPVVLLPPPAHLSREVMRAALERARQDRPPARPDAHATAPPAQPSHRGSKKP